MKKAKEVEILDIMDYGLSCDIVDYNNSGSFPLQKI